jgi:hypothetical protein
MIGFKQIEFFHHTRCDDAGRIRYSTDPHAPSARAVGKVWRNPMSILVLDRGARPKP